MNRNFYSLLLMFSLFLFACGKKDLPQPEKDPLKFSIEQIKELNTGIYPVRYELYFKNESDSGEDISYRWRFGDGGTADGYNTNHAYLESGNYTVWLTKYKAGLAVDSNNIAIKVDAIPIIIRQSDLFYSHPVAIGTFENKVYLAGIHTFPYKENVGYREESYLTQYDSLWREQWTKTFSSEIGKISNMSVAANGDVLLAVIKNRGKSSLYRIDGNGNVKWTWTTPLDVMSIFSATEDKQGNIVIMCTKPVSPSWANITIQLDASGKEKWTYDWGVNDMNFCYKLVTLPDGYIMTGSGFCVEPCLHIAKLSLDGKNVWNATVPRGKSNDIGDRLGVYTVLDPSNQLQVFCAADYTYHTFDLNGKYLASRELSVKMAPGDVLVNKTGSVLVAGDQLINGTSKATLLELKSNNTTGWVYNSFTSIIDLDLVQYPRYTRSTSVMALTDKNIGLFTGHLSWSKSSSGEYYATFVCPVDANGKLF